DPKEPFALYGRGIAKGRAGDADGGKADTAAAQALLPDVAAEFDTLGLK
ncbi:MAG: hypothetical protein JO230_06155, partial [Xanthobacteraceae bacterium]|nr:hypothetical protein [Xanthobacteraceae bacterium]